MIKKIVLSGGEARKKLLAGARRAGELVGTTLGHKGRNVIIQTAYHAPKITNDGVTLLRHLVLDDEIEDLGCQSIVEAAMKTNERAGDGTTTTAVIASTLVEDCAQKIQEAEKSTLEKRSVADVIGMSSEILIARDTVIEALKKQARTVKKGDIKSIVSTSLGKLYPQFVDTITDMVERAGVDGYISVEDNWGTKYGMETVMSEGLRFMGSYASPLLTAERIVNGQLVLNKNKEAVWEDAVVLVTNHRLETPTVLSSLFGQFREQGNALYGKRKIVIFAAGFEKSVVSAVNSSHMNALEGGGGDPIKVLAVKAPTLTTDQWEDVAAFCGARFINKDSVGGELAAITPKMLGKARKIVVDEDHTTVNGGSGNVAERVKMLKNELETEKDTSFKEQIRRRLGAMQSGFGIIRVGAATEPERDYIKYKIEDAVNAAKAAMEEGVVKGGGLALKEIADSMGKESIVYEALVAPYKRIRSNAGGDVKVPATVIDPVKVTRLAVENAFSVAAQLITAEVAIAQHRKTLTEELSKLMPAHTNADEDFRSDANQEVGYGT